jgi:hypothetical protein
MHEFHLSPWLAIVLLGPWELSLASQHVAHLSSMPLHDVDILSGTTTDLGARNATWSKNNALRGATDLILANPASEWAHQGLTLVANVFISFFFEALEITAHPLERRMSTSRETQESVP